MKTLNYLIATVLILNASFALADGWRKETVTGRFSEKDGGKALELTAEESKQGGVLSKYDACKGYVMVGPVTEKRGQSLKQKQDDYWKTRATKCDPSNSNCDLKSIYMPIEKQEGDVTKFLQKVRDRAIQDLTANIKKLSTKRFSCLDAKYDNRKDFESMAISASAIKKDDPECPGWLSDIRKRLAVERPGFRRAAALMTVPTVEDVQRAIVSGDSGGLVNSDLKEDTTWGYIPKMEKLSNSEMGAAKATFEKAIGQARKEFAEENEKLLAPLKVKGREVDLANERKRLERAENFSTKVREALGKVRLDALKDYNSILSRSPEIAYVGSPEADSKELAVTLGKMIQDSRESLMRIKMKGAEPLQFAAYSRLINTMLNEELNKGDSSSCALATAAREKLESKKTRDGLVATGVIVGGSILVAAAPALSGLGVPLPAAMVANSVQLSIATGLIGGAYVQGEQIHEAMNTAQDSRTGLTNKEDSDEERNSAVFGSAMSPLNFVGTSPLIKAGAAIAGAKLGGTWARFGLASAAKGDLKLASANADKITKLAVTAAAGSAKNVTAAEAATTTKEIARIGEDAAKAVLHRVPDATDDAVAKTLADAGVLGTPAKPDFSVANTYAQHSMTMAEADKVKFADDLKKVIAAGDIKPSKEAVGAVAERARVANALTVKIAAASPNPEATAALLRGTSGWNTQSLKGVEAVMDRGLATVRKGETVGAANERAIAEGIGKPVGSPEVKQLCTCSKLCWLVGGTGKKVGDRFPASEKKDVSVAACTLNP